MHARDGLPVFLNHWANSLLLTHIALGIGSCLVSFAILIGITIALRFYLIWQNKLRASARHAVEESSSQEDLARYGFRNLSDKQNPLFVYVY